MVKGKVYSEIGKKLEKYFEEKGEVIISLNKLAEMFGCVRGNIIFQMKGMMKRGVLTREKRQNKVSGYLENVYVWKGDKNSKENLNYVGASGMKKTRAKVENGKFLSKVDGKWYPLSERYGHNSMTKKQAKERYYRKVKK